MGEFLGCENVSDFKNLTPTEGDFPASQLWRQAQSFWLHPLIFEIAEGSPTQRAANLALAVIEVLSGNLMSEEEMQAKDRAKEVHNLLLFLWAVKKSLTTKVTLGDPPGSEKIDNRCQSILAKLSPRKNWSKSSSQKTSPSTSSPGKTSPSRFKSSSRSKSRSRSRSRFPNES
jgi:hypothetical protein